MVKYFKYLFFSLLWGPSLIISVAYASRKPLRAHQYEALSGMPLNAKAKASWDQTYSKKEYVFGKSPARFLAQNAHFLGQGSKVLDMGMGEGRNAVFLASKGHEVTGVDISPVAIRKAQKLAREQNVRIKAIEANMETISFPPQSFDAIICYYYVDRSLHEKMLTWLRPGGLLIYEAYTDRQKQVEGFDKLSVDHLLRPGELLTLFPQLKVLKYEEPLHVKKEYRASLISQKQASNKE